MTSLPISSLLLKCPLCRESKTCAFQGVAPSPGGAFWRPRREGHTMTVTTSTWKETNNWKFLQRSVCIYTDIMIRFGKWLDVPKRCNCTEGLSCLVVLLFILYPILDTRISFVLLRPSVTLRVPPWILKRGWVESAGQRLISSIGKTERIAFLFNFFDKKNIFKIFQFFEKRDLFLDFLKFLKFSNFLGGFMHFLFFFGIYLGFSCFL